MNFTDSASAKRAMEQMNGFELAGRPMKVNTVSERSDGSMSFLDDEETEKGGIEMNAQSRASLMQKLAQTHGSGQLNFVLLGYLNQIQIGYWIRK